jgi:peptide/nickel transport system permease protein
MQALPHGFEVSMLTFPSKETTEKKWKYYFLGFPAASTTLPLLNFTIKESELVVIPFNIENDLNVLEKTYTILDFPGYDSLDTVVKDLIVKKKYWLGTDKYGRDLLSRLIIGSRVSIAIGFVAVIISVLLGLFFGAIGGFYGGKIDALVMWIVNVIWSIPTLLLVIAITLALGKGFWQVFVAVGLTMWVEVARVVRGQIISVKEMQFVTAARALGYNNFRIIFYHILPNVMTPVIVIAAANFASAVLVESGLSFLGLGAQPPVPSWGGMIKDHYSYIILGKSYLALVPGIAIMLLTLALMLTGNALRDAMDVRTH